MNLIADILIDCKNDLGEGIQWSQSNQRLYWVDIVECKLCSCDEFGNDFISKQLPERLCSFAFDPDGNMLCAFASGLYRYHSETGERDLLFAFEADLKETRLNDGRCDAQGRFIVGGYNECGPEPISSVISYTKAGAQTLIKNVKCTNSLGFSIDGTRMYFTDTPTKKIIAYDYDKTTGRISNKTLFATLSDDEGVPDGSVVDAEDALWNAQFRGGRVQRFLKDGTRDICVNLPAPNITCACFGGANLNKLYITTARHKMTADAIAEYPHSGGVFVVEPGVTGNVEHQFKECLF